MRHLLPLMLAFPLCVLSGSGLAGAAAMINVINNDGAGEGFNDPAVVAPVGGNPGTTLGAQRLNAFEFAAEIWADLITSDVEIRVAAEFNPLFCDPNVGAVLGSAGAGGVDRDFVGAPVAATFYPDALADKLAGTDLFPPGDDIGAEFNSSIGTTCTLAVDWYYGLDASSGLGEVDFVTTVLHELGHGLGFATYVDDITGAKFLGFDDVFMLQLEDHSTGGALARYERCGTSDLQHRSGRPALGGRGGGRSQWGPDRWRARQWPRRDVRSLDPGSRLLGQPLQR